MQWIGTAGTGSISASVNRGADNDAMTGNAVMYDVRKILAVGGAPDYGNDYATSNATLIDISSRAANTRTIARFWSRRARLLHVIRRRRERGTERLNHDSNPLMTRALNRAAFTLCVTAARFLVAVKPAANGMDSSQYPQTNATDLQRFRSVL
ncbi:hypothetical protein [Paraburkholderia sp. WC7.3d]|uniref:hypothetical protein n=1 Tax=Paraburkholderia TaxID=1822464 RepID=UPI003D1B78B9